MFPKVDTRLRLPTSGPEFHPGKASLSFSRHQVEEISQILITGAFHRGL